MQLTQLPFAQETVTVYNRRAIRVDGKTQTSYHRTVLDNCFWQFTRQRRLQDGTWLVVNEFLCKIPEDTAYVSPALWNTTAVAPGSFTLAPEDVIVLGIGPAAPATSKDLLDLVSSMKPAGAMTVLSVSDWTTSGRALGHYAVIGA